MSNDLGVFPPSPRGDGRYAARRPQRPWTNLEDMVLHPVLLACQSERAYLQACRFLCRVLDREPCFPEGSRPAETRVAASCVSIIERRTITELMSCWPIHFNPEALGVLGCRSEMPASWAEVARFLRPFREKQKKNTTQIGYEELLLVLDRVEVDDYGWLRELLDRIDDPTLNITEDLTAQAPCRPQNERPLKEAILTYINTPTADGRGLRNAWKELHEILQ